MSWCGGRVCCAIYREKVYCRRGNHADEYTPCDCRHARYRCEVEACAGKGDWCPGPDLKEAEAGVLDAILNGIEDAETMTEAYPPTGFAGPPPIGRGGFGGRTEASETFSTGDGDAGD